eukprot:CAMPEP_0206438978 /NCGR_PEP_ID=MMETSP0324_2-20121206/11947_1 /ASSEMBLY_ACC=CAM_ASM_000836 /TAXON_ID=2866 /ORGANISM="Crypthecodinium cohnii, Strain Seligo" /LENGTH=943 /DNA_ID=CAMNT_0053906531 /DNA_START=324 /DNA_END=3155 /DNA_ORIENTATION=-
MIPRTGTPTHQGGAIVQSVNLPLGRPSYPNSGTNLRPPATSLDAIASAMAQQGGGGGGDSPLRAPRGGPSPGPPTAAQVQSLPQPLRPPQTYIGDRVVWSQNQSQSQSQLPAQAAQIPLSAPATAAPAPAVLSGARGMVPPLSMPPRGYQSEGAGGQPATPPPRSPSQAAAATAAAPSAAAATTTPAAAAPISSMSMPMPMQMQVPTSGAPAFQTFVSGSQLQSQQQPPYQSQSQQQLQSQQQQFPQYGATPPQYTHQAQSMTALDRQQYHSGSNQQLGGAGQNWATAPPAPQLPPQAIPGRGTPMSPPTAGTPFETSQNLGASLDIVVVVSRLLDMPVESTIIGTALKYRVRVLNDKQELLGTSLEIEGDNPKGKAQETVPVSKSDGTIRFKKSRASPLLLFEVEHIGGLLGRRAYIGSCQVNRTDPRAAQVWPYALTDQHGELANCGVELKIVDESRVQGQGAAASQGAATPSMGAMSPSSAGSPGSRNAVNFAYNVSAFLEFDKISDLPFPRNEIHKDVELAILSQQSTKELKRLGPFAVLSQQADAASSSRSGGDHRTDPKQQQDQRKLARANCAGAAAFVQDALHFGGDAAEGSMFLRISASFVSPATRSGSAAGGGKVQAAPELIGVTSPIKVTWVPTQGQYYPLLSREGKTIGGIYLRHRLLTQQEAQGQADPNKGLLGAFSSSPKKQQQQRRPPLGIVEPMHRVSGRTGNFPKGSIEEAYEQAALNAEAQNRAVLQRCKRADPQWVEREPHVTTINGYRQWDSLDSLFATMGPNPMAMSDEVGPSVTRSYKENHTLAKELRHRMPGASNVADDKMCAELLRTMTDVDPTKVVTSLRPIICKDPKEIQKEQDMSWCPDPPVYIPIRNLREEDKETLRLACYAPEQTAQLSFIDANPNYRVDEDIWGVLADYKKAESLYVPKRPGQQRRVKDDCIMA